MSEQYWPDVEEIARELRSIRDRIEISDECDVRLQVYEDGDCAVRWGPSDHDQDHRGWWGASSIHGRLTRDESVEIAEDLLEQAQEHHAQEEEV